eukprot:SAG31_NODE_2109_length_6426_cov_13.928244_8_plen_220_part_00
MVPLFSIRDGAGIDPGTKGAAVLLRADGSLCAATKLPHIGSDLDLRNLTVWLEDACAAEGTRPDQIAAAVEALGNRPSNSVRSVRQPAPQRSAARASPRPVPRLPGAALPHEVRCCARAQCVTMGKNWGRIDAWLALIIGCRYDVPNPRRWQREMCPGPGDAKVRRPGQPALRQRDPCDSQNDTVSVAPKTHRSLAGEPHDTRDALAGSQHCCLPATGP